MKLRKILQKIKEVIRCVSLMLQEKFHEIDMRRWTKMWKHRDFLVSLWKCSGKLRFWWNWWKGRLWVIGSVRVWCIDVVWRFYMVRVGFLSAETRKRWKTPKTSGDELMKETVHLLMKFDLREVGMVSTYCVGDVWTLV